VERPSAVASGEDPDLEIAALRSGLGGQGAHSTLGARHAGSILERRMRQVGRDGFCLASRTVNRSSSATVPS